LKLLDVGAIAGTACEFHITFESFALDSQINASPHTFADASQPWIDTTSIDLNPQAPHVIKSNFFDFPIPDSSNDDDLFDVVSLSLVMNFEGSLVNRGTSYFFHLRSTFTDVKFCSKLRSFPSESS